MRLLIIDKAFATKRTLYLLTTALYGCEVYYVVENKAKYNVNATEIWRLRSMGRVTIEIKRGMKKLGKI